RPNGSTCRQCRKATGALFALSSQALRLRLRQASSRDPAALASSLPRDSSGSKAWRVHHQHRDHAAKKNEQHNCQPDNNSVANRVAFLSLTPERRRVGKIGSFCVWDHWPSHVDDGFWHSSCNLTDNLAFGRVIL